MTAVSIVTVASRRQLAHVKALAASVERAGAAAQIDAVIVDDPALAAPADLAAGLRVLPPTTVPPTILHQLRILASSGPELARALIPWVAGGPLPGRSHRVIVSPATWIGAALGELERPLDGVRLVPSRLHSRPDPTTPGRGFQRSCLALGPVGDAFAQWWAQRELDRAVGLFGGWAIEEAAASLPHEVTDDPGIGVDAWNAAERSIRDAGAGFVVDGGGPLRTFHFDDFDPLRPHLAVGDPSRPPPVRLSEHDGLRRLHDDYAAVILELGYADADASPYPWDHLPGGIPVDTAARHAYRSALRAHRQQMGAEPPDPFVRGGLARFVEFLNEPAVESGGRYSRYVFSLYQTWPKLDSVFPDVMAGDRRHFVWWLNRFARADGRIPSVIELPRVPRSTPVRARTDHGVNVAGYLKAESGLAVSARRSIAALERAGVLVRPITYRRTMSRQEPGPVDDGHDGLFDVNLACVTAEQFPFFHADMGDEFFAGRYTIGYWYWELEVFAPDQLGALDLVDEVWVATSHVRDAVAPLTSKPVRHMPIPLLEPRPSNRRRSSFGLPDDAYVFLFVFDFDSVMMRKHPLGAVAAFCEAFPSPGTARHHPDGRISERA